MAPSSRLLTLLQEALSYEKEHGLLPDGEQLDVFRNVVETVVLEDAVPTVKVGLFSDARFRKSDSMMSAKLMIRANLRVREEVYTDELQTNQTR